MDKYARQRGLVAQDIVMDAQVTVHGTGPALPYLLQCLALAGVGARYGSIRLCLEDRAVVHADLADQFLLQPDDLGEPIGSALTERVAAIDEAINIAVAAEPPARGLVVAVPAAAEMAVIADTARVDVWGQVLKTAVYIGPRPLRLAAGERRGILTAALAATCGGLLTQTVLGQLGALIAGPAVLSSWLEERLWLSHPGIGVHTRAAMMSMAAMTDGPVWPALDGVLERACPAEVAGHFRIMLGGRVADSRVTSVIDDDAVLVSVKIPQAETATPMTAVRPHLAVPPPVRPLLWSPVEGPALDGDQVSGDDVPLPELMPPLRVVVCGTGALGSWASAVLAAARFPDVNMCLVDMDDTIETHNLNRQVLFGETDVGEPKVRRAMERLNEIDPSMRLQALQVEVVPDLIDELVGGTITYENLDEEFREDHAAYHAQIAALSSALAQATAVLSCPDNQQTRWSLNVIAEQLGIPLVNGAMAGFTGRVHVCDPGDGGCCLVCWLGTSIARDVKRHQCTGLDDIPVSSIVTSAAIVGASQAAALIAAIAGAGRRVRRFHTFDGMSIAMAGYRARDRDPEECPAHLFTAGDPEPRGRESDGSTTGRLQDR
jgi:molybdopterin/thiamine biosynthesis adenylyltransferase